MIRYLECVSSETVDSVCAEADGHLKNRLERQLQSHILLPVRVHIRDNELQLSGVVTSWAEKQQAQEIAREVAIQYRICNELQVSTGQE